MCWMQIRFYRLDAFVRAFWKLKLIGSRLYANFGRSVVIALYSNQVMRMRFCFVTVLESNFQLHWYLNIVLRLQLLFDSSSLYIKLSGSLVVSWFSTFLIVSDIIIPLVDQLNVQCVRWNSEPTLLVLLWIQSYSAHNIIAIMTVREIKKCSVFVWK